MIFSSPHCFQGRIMPIALPENYSGLSDSDASARLRDMSLLRSLQRPNRAAWWIALIAPAVLLAILFTPWLRALFYFVVPDAWGWLLAIATGMVGTAVFEAIKYLRMRGLRRVATAAVT